MLEKGGRMGEEFQKCWGTMRLEAAEAARWMDEEELEGPLRVTAASAGEGSTNGSTRKLVMEQLEESRYKLVSRGLSVYHDQEARPCWSWPDRDKQTTAWVLTLTGLTGPEFSEAAGTQLCLPSPACASMLGETVRGAKKVDLFGDNVRAATLKGLRRRWPSAETDARWRCVLLIINLTAHYDSQFCVSFNFCFDQESLRCL